MKFSTGTRVALAASVAASTAPAAPAWSAGRTEQIRLVERATSDVTSHVGPKDDNPGDVLTFANDVFDAANAVKLGTDQGFCIRVVVGKSFECMWTTSLAGGQITVQGPFLDKADSVLAVTGGTGSYANVRGEMALHSRDASGSTYDFAYTLHHPD